MEYSILLSLVTLLAQELTDTSFLSFVDWTQNASSAKHNATNIFCEGPKRRHFSIKHFSRFKDQQHGHVAEH